MTIITKPLSEKKEAKPLDAEAAAAAAAVSAPVDEDVESQGSDHAFIILRTRARRVSTVTTLCLLMSSLVVVGVGILAGTHLYRQYLRSQIFKGAVAIPLPSQGEQMFMQADDSDLTRLIDAANEDMAQFESAFREEFEIDTNNEAYEKITVPDFKNGRVGRFVHDFNSNQTGIIDVTGRRCFVMPMDMNNTLPPRSMFDLIQKMWQGYYKVDTQVVRESYKVQLPEISDMSQIGPYIASECTDQPIYKLEKSVEGGGIWKRSADQVNDLIFTQFAGKNVVEFGIKNLKAVEEYENQKRG